MLFIIVLEALSREFHTSCAWELLYADDLVLIAKKLDLLMEKLKLWKNNERLCVDMAKTKVMNCGKGLDTIKPFESIHVVYAEEELRGIQFSV